MIQIPNDYFYSVIPISYYSGTGGNFLRAFITDAKYNNHTNIELSQFGNAHTYIKDFPIRGFNLEDDDTDKLVAILNTKPITDSESPYYVQTHITNMDMLIKNFHRNIRIVFDEDDFLDIFYIFLGKIMNDIMNITHGPTIDLTVDKLDKYFLIHRRAKHNFGIKKYHRCFQNDNKENVLYISFNDLLRGNIEILIYNISKFTEIPTQHFNVNNLIRWRELTNNCIKYVQDKI